MTDRQYILYELARISAGQKQVSRVDRDALIKRAKSEQIATSEVLRETALISSGKAGALCFSSEAEPNDPRQVGFGEQHTALLTS